MNVNVIFVTVKRSINKGIQADPDTVTWDTACKIIRITCKMYTFVSQWYPISGPSFRGSCTSDYLKNCVHLKPLTLSKSKRNSDASLSKHHLWPKVAQFKSYKLIISCFSTISWSFKSSCRFWWVIVCPRCGKETKADLRDSLSSPDTAVSIVIGEAKCQTSSEGSLCCTESCWADCNWPFSSIDRLLVGMFDIHHL